jgi:DNA-directed RNA polymerase subunit RPC12/RpoP
MLNIKIHANYRMDDLSEFQINMNYSPTELPLFKPLHKGKRKPLIYNKNRKNRSCYSCTICTRRFNIINKDYDYACDESRRLVTQHVLSTHSQYCYKCKECGKLYITSEECRACKCEI